jgi:hypothetical protein
MLPATKITLWVTYRRHVQHADTSKNFALLRTKGYKVYNKGEWRGRGVARLCRVFKIRRKQLEAGRGEEHLAPSWSQVRIRTCDPNMQVHGHGPGTCGSMCRCGCWSTS